MNKKQVILLVLSIIISTSNVLAQSDVDALRLSLQYNNGTARNIGIGNTMGSIGGDISTIFSNPAGLGRISSTEVSLTPVVSIFNSKSTYINNKTSDSKLNFGVYNISAVLSSKYLNNNSSDKWGNIKFGVGYNNLANLNQSFYLSGFNKHNSLVDKYYELLYDNANTTYDLENMYPFDASLAYNTDLIYFDSTDSRIYTAINNGNVQQDMVIQRKGSLGEFAVAIASNYKTSKDKKINFGATIGIPTLNFTEKITHKETDVPDSSYNFNFFEQNSVYRLRGFGINLKLGVLAELSKNFRMSLAFHTPSVIFVDDAFANAINADYNTYTAEAESPDGLMKYNLRLPWRLQTGLSYITKYGLIAAEYELSDASGSKFNYKDANSGMKDDQNLRNQLIQDKYKIYHTVKLGLEGRIDPILIRTGVQIQTSPFDKNVVSGQAQNNFIYSAGIGFRKKSFYGDLAYQFIKGKDSYTPYTLNNESIDYQYTGESTFKRSVIALTVGYKF